MTLVLELPAEVESELRQGAAARGVAVEDFAVERLRRSGDSRRASIAATLRASSARLAPLFPEADPVASFLAQKRGDVERESARDFGA